MRSSLFKIICSYHCKYFQYLIILVTFLIITTISSIVYAEEETIGIFNDIEVGYHQTIDNVSRAQQGIAAHNNRFYTSGGAAAQEEWLFKYAPSWGKNNVVEYQRIYFDDGFGGVEITHIGDIDGYSIRLYGIFTDSEWSLGPIGGKRAEKAYVAWFSLDNLDQGTNDYIDVSFLTSVFPDMDDISGLAFKDDRLYLLGYHVDESDTPKIFSISMDGLKPDTSVAIPYYEIETFHANGLTFYGDYIFISWGPTSETEKAYIDIYKYPLASQASKIITYQYETGYTHAEGITLKGDEIWVAQGTHILQLENPVPQKTTSISASDGSNLGMVRVQWNSVLNADGYDIYRNTTDNSNTATLINSISGTMYDDTNISNGSIYYYWIKATKNINNDKKLIGEFSTSDSGYAGVTQTSINLSLNLNPSSTTPGSPVTASGTAYYNTGTAVTSGTVSISVSGQVYTAAISNGSYSRTIYAPSSTGNYTVSASANDGLGRIGSASKTLSVQSNGSGSGYTFTQALMCRNIQTSDPYMYIDETEVFGEPDSKIYLWFELTNIYGAHSGEEKWYRPDGSYWGGGTFTIPDAEDSGYLYWDWFRINRYINLKTYQSVLDSEGEWTVKIYIDGTYQRSLKFYVRYDLTEHRLCKNFDTSDPWMYHDPTNIFYQTDSKVAAWYQFEYVRQDLEIKWKAYEPTGVLYTEWAGNVDEPTGDYWDWWRHTGWFTLNGTIAAQKCGNWHIEFLVKDIYGNWDVEYDDYFQILESPNVNPTVNTSVTPTALIENQSITISTTASDNTYLDAVELHWKLNGVEQPPQITSNLNKSSHTISKNVGSFSPDAQIEYWAVARDTSANRVESEHHTITVLPQTYSITISSGSNGSIDPSGYMIKNADSDQQFTAAANSGYTVDTWYLDGSSVQTGGNTYILQNIQSSHTVNVTFKQISVSPYTITASSGPNGLIDPNGNILKSIGEDQQFTATANSGYMVDSWYLDGSPVQSGSNTYTLQNIQSDHSVQVTFFREIPEPSYMTAVAGVNGSIDPEGAIYITKGGTKTFTATPYPGYTVDTWYLDYNSVQTGGNTYTLENTQSDQFIQVTFKLLQQYNLTINVNGQGSIEIDPAGGVYSSGTQVNLKAKPDSGYKVKSWSGTDDDSSTSTINTVTMDGNKTVTVEFELIQVVNPPVITSINPTSGPAGSFIKIEGSNFGDTAGNVDFGGTDCNEIVSWSDTEIFCKVPDVNTESSGTVNEGLVAYYPFNGNAQDSSGNNNHGIEYGGVSYVDGVIGQAAKFDGLDDYVEIAYSDTMDVWPDFTVSAWISQHSWSPYTGAVITRGISGSTYDDVFSMYANIDADVENGVGTYFYHGHNIDTGQDLDLDTFYHFTVRKKNNLVELFVDGQKIIEETLDISNPFIKDYVWWIGAQKDYGDLINEFDGIIDEVRIYNRALSDSEIAKLYLAEAENTINDGLLAYYPFNGDTNDMSGNERDVTAYNYYEYLDGVSSQAIRLVGEGHTGLNGGHVLLPYIPLNEYPEFTISIWANHEGHSSYHGENFVTFGASLDPYGAGNWVSIGYNNFPDYTLDFSVGGNSDGRDAGRVGIPYPSDFFGNWNHLVLRADNGILTAFLNGQSIGTDSYELGSMSSVAGLGCHWFNSGGTESNRFIGMIDDVRIYNRALSATEVNDLYIVENDISSLMLANQYINDLAGIDVENEFSLKLIDETLDGNNTSSIQKFNDISDFTNFMQTEMLEVPVSIQRSDNAVSNIQNFTITTPDTLYVDLSNTSGIENGTTEYPFSTIQRGIDAASDGATVIVADGTYTGEGNRDIDFLGKAIIVKSQNDLGCAIVCEGTETEPHRGFYFHSGEKEDSVLKGFYINTGYAEYGGGIYCTGSSPTITNNYILYNVGNLGGGICCDANSSPIINNNRINENHGILGGGIYVQSGLPVISNNTISENIVEYSGGGICCMNSNLSISNNTINKNKAELGGGVYCYDSSPKVDNNRIQENGADMGGGIYCEEDSSPLISNNQMSDNSSNNGGGVCCIGTSPEIYRNNINDNLGIMGGGIYCQDDACPSIINNVITSNIGASGGGIYCINSTPVIANNTISKNDVSDNGDGVCCQNSSPLIINCIIWENADQEIFADADSNLNITYSNIKGGWPGTGNIDSDPQLADIGNGDFHLLPNSPCIDTGDPNSEYGLEPEPDGGRINIGAYGNTPEATSKGGLVLVSYNLVGAPVRVGRTSFDYTYTMTLLNSSNLDISDVQVELLTASANMTLIDPNISFSYIESGNIAISDDTFTIRVDAATSIDMNAISWKAEFDWVEP